MFDGRAWYLFEKFNCVKYIVTISINLKGNPFFSFLQTHLNHNERCNKLSRKSHKNDWKMKIDFMFMKSWKILWQFIILKIFIQLKTMMRLLVDLKEIMINSWDENINIEIMLFRIIIEKKINWLFWNLNPIHI
jgi:hypothetical protein